MSRRPPCLPQQSPPFGPPLLYATGWRLSASQTSKKPAFPSPIPLSTAVRLAAFVSVIVARRHALGKWPREGYSLVRCLLRKAAMTEVGLNIRRIDSRREDIRAAMAELRAGSARRETSSARPGGGGRSRCSASRFRRSRWSSGSAATCSRRAGGRAGLFGPDRQGRSLRPTTIRVPAGGVGRRPMPRPIRNCSKRSAAWPQNIREFQAGDPAPRRAAGAARRISGRSGIGRWIGWAFACRAGPPPIPRPC